MRRLDVAINHRQDCFLSNLSQKARFSGGKKISRSMTIKALINVVKDLDIDVKGVKTEKELKKRICQAFVEDRV